MDDEIETLMIDVRASTTGFKADISAMRNTFDSTLVEGFSKAGNVLEKGLVSAIKRGNIGFDDLKRTALSTLNEIAATALHSGVSSIVGTQSKGSVGSALTGVVGSLLGLPGRATGGPVSPGQAYLVGERGPEVFVPTSSGKVDAGSNSLNQQRSVRVSINLPPSKGGDAPIALRRSSRQVASAVSRALRTF